jgi:hypothetical protein
MDSGDFRGLAVRALGRALGRRHQAGDPRIGPETPQKFVDLAFAQTKPDTCICHRLTRKPSLRHHRTHDCSPPAGLLPGTLGDIDRGCRALTTGSTQLSVFPLQYRTFPEQERIFRTNADLSIHWNQ